jgi:MFS family permease
VSGRVAPRLRVPIEWSDLYPLIAAVGIGCGVTVLFITVFNYFVTPMGSDLGLSSAEVSGVLSVYLAAQIVGFPIAGQLADRFGARPVIFVSTVAYASAFAWLARLESQGELYAVAFFGGLLGSGAGPVCYTREIVRRFDRHRGLALGTALAGGGLAAMVLPFVVRPVVLGFGWRSGFVLLAGLAAGAGILGALCSRTAGAGESRAQRQDSGLKEAASTLAFWKMTAAFSLLALSMAAVIAHFSEIWHAFGIDTAGVPRFQATMGAATIVGRLLGGAAMDRIPAKVVGASAAACGAAGLLLLGVGHEYDLLLAVSAIALGFCLGAESDVVSYLSCHYFGLERFARVYSAQAAFFLVGFAAGPVSFAVLAQRFGTKPVLFCASAILVLSAVSVLSLKPPARESA